MLPVVVLLLVSGALIWQIGNARRTVNALQIADNNIATATLLTALVVDEETGLRGFQTTSNEIFLQPFLSASSVFSLFKAEAWKTRSSEMRIRRCARKRIWRSVRARVGSMPLDCSTSVKEGTLRPAASNDSAIRVDASRSSLCKATL
jgi:hypothetical protein